MKKFLTLLLTAIMAVACCFGLTACGDGDKVKIGLICLHDEKSTYDKNFIDAMKAACEEKGVELVLKTNIPENEECEDAAKSLADQGCKAIFADSFGHEDYMISAAKKYTNVQFCHATGTKAKTENLANFHNAFANIFEGRYVAGYAAGLKLVEMEQAGKITAENVVVGYVGAFTYAEVISGLTSWYLGVQAGYVENGGAKTADKVIMKVKFTGSWYDEAKERDAAIDLIDNQKCILISQHADSWGAPKACEEKSVPNVSYNGSTGSQCPNTFIISSRINWQPYFEYMIDGVTKEGATIDADWTAAFGPLYTPKGGAVCLTELGSAAAANSEEKLDKVVYELKNGSRIVYNIDTFTVGGKKINDSTYEKFSTYSKYLKTANGITYFAESDVELYRSAPYFDINIDGITFLNTEFGS